ncbi:RNA polymerase, sigma 70 (Sigma D) factor [Candidatus Nasuia deltocephalinicola]|nr:RNA polymerase, sigma 70 (Sigma D) factor [Candidatus Nasuia deltocephalinicola]
MNNLLNINEKKKIKFLIKKFFIKKKYICLKYIYKKIKNIIIFSRKNLFFISYNYLFFFLKNFNLNYLKKIINILKIFNIKIYEYIPLKNEYYINLELKKKLYKKKDKLQKHNEFFFKKKYLKKINDLKKRKNITNIYKLIEKKLIKVKKYIIKNFFIFNILILKIKLKKNNFKKILKNILKKKSNNYKKIFKIFFYKKNNLKKIKILNKKNEKYKNKLFYKFNSFLKNIIINSKLDKFKIYKKFFKKINFKKNNLIIDINLLDEIYKLLLIYNNKIEKIKRKLYDITSNITKINLLKFIFYFNKNGTNINWIFNVIDLSKIDKKFIKKYKKFILNQKIKLKKIEKKISIPLKSFIKIFSFIELNKFKIDIIKNDILESNLYLVNYATIKYFKKELYWDYVQEGILGLIYSINKFKYKYNNFKNFTIFNIKSNVNKFFYKSDNLINLPKTLIYSIKKINEITNFFIKKYNKKPDIKYLEEKTKLSKKEIIKVLRVYNKPLSLEEKINIEDSEETRYIDIVKDENQLDLDEYIFDLQLKKNINNILKNFSKNNRKIISNIYGLSDFKKYSYSEIIRKYKITKEEIISINKFFLKKMNEPDIINNLKNFIR